MTTTQPQSADDLLTEVMTKRNCTKDEAREFIVTLGLVLHVSKQGNRLYKAIQRLQPALADFEPALYRKLQGKLPGLYAVMEEIREHTYQVIEEIADPPRSPGT